VDAVPEAGLDVAVVDFAVAWPEAVVLVAVDFAGGVIEVAGVVDWAEAVRLGAMKKRPASRARAARFVWRDDSMWSFQSVRRAGPRLLKRSR
jgi:hypothetical protein